MLPFKFSAVHLEEFLLNKLITMPLLVPAVLIGIRLSNKYIGAHCEICVDSFVSLGLKKIYRVNMNAIVNKKHQHT